MILNSITPGWVGGSGIWYLVSGIRYLVESATNRSENELRGSFDFLFRKDGLLDDLAEDVEQGIEVRGQASDLGN